MQSSLQSKTSFILHSINFSEVKDHNLIKLSLLPGSSSQGSKVLMKVFKIGPATKYENQLLKLQCQQGGMCLGVVLLEPSQAQEWTTTNADYLNKIFKLRSLNISYKTHNYIKDSSAWHTS